MHRFSFVLRSGHVVEFKADHVSLKWKGDQLLSYDVTGVQGDTPMWINIAEIAAVIQHD